MPPKAKASRKSAAKPKAAKRAAPPARGECTPPAKLQVMASPAASGASVESSEASDSRGPSCSKEELLKLFADAAKTNGFELSEVLDAHSIKQMEEEIKEVIRDAAAASGDDSDCVLQEFNTKHVFTPQQKHDPNPLPMGSGCSEGVDEEPTLELHDKGQDKGETTDIPDGMAEAAALTVDGGAVDGAVVGGAVVGGLHSGAETDEPCRGSAVSGPRCSAVVGDPHSAGGPPQHDKRNSATHKNEYMQFLRQCRNRKTFPVSLHEQYSKDPVGLFRMFLDNDCDVKQVALQVTREAQTKTMLGTEYVAVRQERLEELYGKADAQVIMERKIKKGLCVADDEFPDKPERRLYWIKEKQNLKLADITSDKVSAQAATRLSNTEVEEALSAGGLLQKAAVGLGSRGDAIGGKSLTDMLARSVKTPPKPKAKPAPAALPPDSPAMRAEAVMEKLLKEAGEARGYSLSLKAFKMSNELVDQLAKISTECETLFNEFQALTIANVKKEERYEPLLLRAARIFDHFDERKALAASLKHTLQRRQKKKQESEQFTLTKESPPSVC